MRRLAVGCCVALTLLAAWAAPRLIAQDSPVATLVWDAVPGADGYIVYWGSASRTYSNSQDVGDDTHWNIPAPAPGGSVYMVVVAYDEDGQISQPSGEVVHPADTPNRAPDARDDVATTAEDTPSAPINVTGNDTDADGDVLTVTNAAVTNPLRGSVAINADDTLTFTPAPNWNGSVTISYTVIDGRGGSDTAFVLVTVTPVNDAPKAVDDAKTVLEDSTNNEILVLANDTDIDDAASALRVSSVTDPPHGSAVVGPTGAVLYTPEPGFTGSDSFVYTVRDAGGLTDIGDVTITVQNANDAPVAVDDAYSTDEDTQLAIDAPGVLGNDTDEDGDALTVLVGTTTQHGNLVLQANGSFTYTPAQNFFGDDSFTYTVSDGHSGTDIGTVSITVRPINDAPTAANDSFNTNEDEPLTVGAPGVLGNDADVDLGTGALSAAVVSSTTHGDLTLNANGSFTYTPHANYNGSDSFTYKANDGSADSAAATVTIVVAAVNDAPVAVNNDYATDEDTPLTVAAPGVLGGDTDVDGDPLTAALVSGPTAEQGTLALAADGGFTFTPALNFNGPVGFTYKANDGTADSNVATVTIAVNAVNDAPVADNDSYEIAEDAVLTVEAAGVLDGDTDVDNTALTAVLAAGPAHGTLALNPNGSFTYTPNANYSGSDSFTYKANDGAADSNIATVSITVTAVNDAPVAANDSYTTNEDAALTITAPGVLSNDTDEEDAALTATLGTNVAHGTLVLNGDGSFSYTPNANYSGTDSFTYTANDGDSASNTATVTITIAAVNDAPIAADDAATVAEDSGATAIDVLANDTDADGDTRTITAVTQGSNGVVVIAAGGASVTYAPKADFAGPDSFTYTVSDGNGGSATATVAVTVTAVNDAPVAVNDAFTTNEDVVLTVMAPTVLANDTDVDGGAGALRAIVVTPTAHGALTLNENGSFTYTPAENFSGTDTFTYKANDGSLDSNDATVTITVVAVNDAPLAADDSASTNEDVAVDIAVLGNDNDPDGGTVTLSSVGTPGHGTASANADGSVRYTPAPNYYGADSFTYTIGDGQGGTASATVTVGIASVNDGPSAGDDTATTNEDVAVDIAVLANDGDPDGGTVSVSAVGTPASGTASLNGDGTIKYTPNANYFGADSFTYTIGDGQGGSASATVTVSVTSVNDGPTAADDTATTNEDTVVDIAVLANDSDPDGGTLSVSSVGAPANGTAIVAGSIVRYTPKPDFFGSDSFTYTISDGQGGSASATVTVSIASVNDGPVAVDDTATTNEDQAVDIAVLGNDSDADNGTLSVSGVGAAANGTAVANAAGVIRYTPNANHFGSDTFTYTISDGQGGSATATVTVAIASVNDGPSAVNDSATTDEDAAVDIAVLANDSDPDGGTVGVESVGDAVNGTTSVNADGSVKYTPNANYFGPDAFTYTISDGQGGSASASVTVMVESVGDAPEAVNDSYATDEDVALTIAAPGVLGNDTDVDSSVLTAIQASAPANGSLTLNGNGSFTYTPNAGFSGTDSFTYRASDGSLESAVATVTITVAAVNDAPVAENDSYATDEDVALTIAAPGVLGNDTDPDGAASLTAALASAPANGTATLNPDGSFTYTPNAGFNGSDRFTYRANDGSLDSNVATVNITIRAVNDAPAAENDSYTTDEDVALTVIAPGVLGNDTDADGETTLTAALVDGPAHGELTLNADGSFTYAPQDGFSGSDRFTYRANDGSASSKVATVSLTIRAVNDAPVAVNDSYQTDEDAALTIAAPGILGNDTDADGETTLTAAPVTGPAHGTLVLNANGSFTYTPNGGFNGSDSFTYRANDGDADSNVATVSITINSVNDAPAASDDSATTPEDTAVDIAVLANDSDPDGGTLSVSAVTAASHGIAAINANGTVKYTPNANYFGPDSFSYTIGDGQGGTATATVTVAVASVNDAPVAVDDSFSTFEDTAASGNVLANDTDIDGGSLSAARGADPANGTLVLNADGSFTYTPKADFTGTDTFTYTVSDGNGGSDTATVTIAVNAVNDAPVARGDAYGIDEDRTLTVGVPGVLGNDTDTEGSPLTAILVSEPANGTLTFNPNGTFTYQPNANYHGLETFTYKANDGTQDSNVATVSIRVSPVNDAPVAGDDAFETNEDTPLSGNVLTNDTDVDGGTLTAELATNVASGTLVLAADGSFTYTPNLNFSGTDTFTYTVRDGNGGSDTGAVTIAVAGANDAPAANNDAAEVAEDSANNPIDVLANDTDLDGDSLTVTAVTQGAHGAVAIAGGGVSYTPNANYAGSDTFSYTIGDGHGATATATVTVTVTAVNDNPVANADAASVAEDSANNSIDVLANDTDIDGDTVTVTAVTQGANGAVAIAGGGVAYTPRPNFVGSDTFSYTIGDGHGGSATATVTVTVTNANDAPVANDDTASVAEDSANNAIDVLANDTDLDEDTLTITAVTQGAHGSVVISAGGVSYTPNANFVGSDSFTYTTADGNGGSDSATVAVTVTNANDAPVANADAATVVEDSLNNLIDVAENDTDLDGDTLTVAAVTQGAHGSVAVAGGGVTYTPNPNYAGADSFTYTIADGQGGSATAAVSVTISPVNDAPEANDDAASVAEDSAGGAIDVLANDTDLDGDTLSVAAVTQGAHGSVAIAGGGVTYIPNANFVGSDSFTYTVSDGHGGSDSATVAVTVTNGNDAPVANADAVTVAEDSVNNPIAVLANDTDLDGDTLTVAAVTQGAHGSVAIAGPGVSYTPNSNYFGPDSFTYTVSDGNGGSSTASVTVTVTPVNDSPVADADSASVLEDSAGNPIDVLANDADLDGDALSVAAVTQGANGTVAAVAGGVSYTPNPNFVGADTFTYTVADGQGGTATASVTVTVANANDAPVANDDAAGVSEDSANNAIDVLANDTDRDGDVLTIAAVTQGGHGSVTIAGSAVSYTPNANFVGSDSFTYTVSDGHGGSDSATVAITVTNANDAPVANADAATVAEDSGSNAIDVLANDADADGDSLTVAAVTQGAHGSVAIAGGAVIYTPNANYAGADSFSYTISDGNGGSATADVSVTVTAVNDAPVAVADAFATTEDTPATGNVLANDTDIDGGALTAALGSAAANGVVALNADGSFTYTPNANFSGADSFTYTVSDGNGGADSATVTITVATANDAPVAMDDAAIADEDTAVVGNVLANDLDADGNPLSATLVDGPGAAAGTLVFAADGSFSFMPAQNFNGAASFTYRASDGAATSNVATVTIGVTAVNDGPSASDDHYFARGGSILILDAPGVLANDEDIDSAALTAVVVSTTTHGELTMNAGGGFTYMPAAGFTGTDSFTYQANDGSLSSGMATVTILVASEIVIAEVEGANRTVTTDPAGTGPTPADPVEASVTSPADGTVTIADTGAPGEAPSGYSLFGQQVIITAPPATAANPLLLVFTLDGSVVPAGQNEHTVVVFRNGAPVAACSPAAGTAASPDPCVASRQLVDGDVRLTIRSSQASAWSFGTNEANAAPVANDDSYVTNEGQMLVVAAPGVLGNDTDADGNTISAAKVSEPAHGAVTLNADGSFAYTPNAGFNGTDGFTYQVSDGRGTSNVAAVSITVIATRRPPVAVNDAASVVEDSAANAINVLANDSDADGDALKITAVTQGANGTVAITGDGTGLKYTPKANFSGSDSFNYTISDGSGFATASVTVTVTPVNDNPDAVADAATILEGSGSETIAVLENDTTIEAGETLTVKSVTQPVNGSVTISAGTAVRYTPKAGFVGVDKFNYTLQDGNGGLDTALVTVTVQARPSITINDTEVVEANTGFTTAILMVRLSHAIVEPVTVKYVTSDGVARVGQDFEATSGTLTFAVGEIAKPITVKVIADTAKERNEVFAVSLSNPSNASIERTNGYVTILDDDSSQTATTSFSNSGPGSGIRRSTPQLRPVDDQVARAGDRVKLDLKVRDGDIEDLAVTIEGLPEGLRYDVEEGAIVGRLSRSESAGEYTITVKISNGRNESTGTFDFTVRPPKG